MKYFKIIAGMLVIWTHAVLIYATPTVSVSFGSPAVNALVDDTASVVVSVTSTYELQGVQVACGVNVTNLIYSPSAGWTNLFSLTGLPHGTNTLTATATDDFGNTGQATRVVRHDTRPTIFAPLPVMDTVARPNINVSFSTADDDQVMPPTLSIYEFDVFNNLGPQLASGSGSIITNLSLQAFDGQVIYLQFAANDSGGQYTNQRVRVSVQSSTNLVEVEHVSEGTITDVSSDRIVFVGDPVGSRTPFIKIKTRTDGAESTVYSGPARTDGNIYLAPQGAAAVILGSRPYAPNGHSVLQWKAGVQNEDVFTFSDSISFLVKGSYGAWSWNTSGGVNPELDFVDLNTETVHTISTLTGGPGDNHFDMDIAANGDVVYDVLSYNGLSHAIVRYRNGTNTTLVNEPANTVSTPKTDGTNVLYVLATSTNQQLMLVNGSGQSKLMEGTVFGPDLLMNNGWIAYERSGGGQTQVWRRSPQGANTQLTFFGTSSTLAALAPNGEVAFYNNSQLYISKGSPQAFPICTVVQPSGFKIFWLDDRWHARLGRSLFQVYTGSTAIVLPHFSSPSMFSMDLVGAVGQRLVLQSSTNRIDWVDVAINNISDGMRPNIQIPISTNVSSCFYRLRSQ